MGRIMVWSCWSVHLFIRLSGCWQQRTNQWIFLKFGVQVCLGAPSINLWFVWSYLIKYVHNYIISDFRIFGIHRVIFFKLEPSNFAHFENLSGC